jgi:hypothetical protein
MDFGNAMQLYSFFGRIIGPKYFIQQSEIVFNPGFWWYRRCSEDCSFIPKRIAGCFDFCQLIEDVLCNDRL